VARGVAHPPELRAEVIAAVRAGTSITQVARQTGLDKSVVSRWVATAPQSAQTVATERSESDSLAELTELIAEHLRETLRVMASTRTARPVGLGNSWPPARALTH
jgi:transposase-like protein